MTISKRWYFKMTLVALLLLAAIFLSGGQGTAKAVSTGVVISQVYGAGGNVGATYQNDFVELFNRGTSTINLSGYSVQYTSASGTGNFSSNITPLTGSIDPGEYYLVQMGGSTANGVP